MHPGCGGVLSSDPPFAVLCPRATSSSLGRWELPAGRGFPRSPRVLLGNVLAVAASASRIPHPASRILHPASRTREGCSGALGDREWSQGSPFRCSPAPVRDPHQLSRHPSTTHRPPLAHAAPSGAEGQCGACVQGLGELGSGGTVGLGVPSRPQQPPRLAGLPVPGTSPALSPLKGGLKGLHLLNIPHASIPGCVSKGTGQGAARMDGGDTAATAGEKGRGEALESHTLPGAGGLSARPPAPQQEAEGRWVGSWGQRVGQAEGARAGQSNHPAPRALPQHRGRVPARGSDGLRCLSSSCWCLLSPRKLPAPAGTPLGGKLVGLAETPEITRAKPTHTRSRLPRSTRLVGSWTSPWLEAPPVLGEAVPVSQSSSSSSLGGLCDSGSYHLAALGAPHPGSSLPPSSHTRSPGSPWGMDSPEARAGHPEVLSAAGRRDLAPDPTGSMRDGGTHALATLCGNCCFRERRDSGGCHGPDRDILSWGGGFWSLPPPVVEHQRFGLQHCP